MSHFLSRLCQSLKWGQTRGKVNSAHIPAAVQKVALVPRPTFMEGGLLGKRLALLHRCMPKQAAGQSD